MNSTIKFNQIKKSKSKTVCYRKGGNTRLVPKAETRVSKCFFYKVDQIDHEIVSGPSRDYFRLLNPGKYTINVMADGYEKASQVRGRS